MLPGLIDLDPDPETPSRTIRLGRLIRPRSPIAACFRASRWPRSAPPCRAAGSGGQLRTPARGDPPPGTWLDSPLFSELRDAARARRAIERARALDAALAR